MSIVTKDVKTLVELKSLDGQEGRSVVMFDASTGEPFALDMEVLINLIKRDGTNSNLSVLKFNTESPLVDVPIGALRWNKEDGILQYRVSNDSYINVVDSFGDLSDVYMPIKQDGDTNIWDASNGRFVRFALSNALGAKQSIANLSNDITADASSTTKYPSVKEIKDYADSLVVGLLDYRGGYNASVNAYPSSGGSGTGGAILKGDMWVVSVAGTIDGHDIHAGDSLIANDDTPGQTTAKWNTVQSNLSYVPEDVANKKTEISESDQHYPSNGAVYRHVAAEKVSIIESLTGQIDGGVPSSVYGGCGVIDGGSPSTIF